MTTFSRGLAASIAALAATSAIACGPSKMELDPNTVVNVNVRPASGQALYCPGEQFQVEVVAKLKDGTQCSSTDPKLGCQGKSDAVIDPKMVRVQAIGADPTGEADQFVFAPNPNPLETAGTGVTLSAWLESSTGASMKGEKILKPVYQCLMKAELGASGAGSLDGLNGAQGPSLRVIATPMSTPFYADAVLVRIESSTGETRYLISPSADQPVAILSRGQDGAQGAPGAPGKEGAPGANASDKCANGGAGGNGTDGGPGGPGGAAGPGGAIDVFFDATVVDKLRSRVLVESLPGRGGPGGQGGRGGPGGLGGAPGPQGDAGADGKPSCTGTKGPNGLAGRAGQAGPPAPPPPASPAPRFGQGSREELFARELKLIQTIEATKAIKN
jgi:hypothetical protein